MNSSAKILFQRIARGEQEAFNEFFALYYPKLVEFAGLFVESVAQAEDVVSDVLTSFLTRREQVFVIDNFEGYLFTAIKNKAYSTLRRNKVAENWNQHAATIPQTPPPTAHETLVAKEFDTLVTHIIENFPPKRRMAYRLVREDGMSYAEVASLLDISVRTVEVHLRLAMRELREKIEAYLMDEVKV